MDDGKIISFELLKIDRQRKKFCNCKNPTYTIDTQNRIVECNECGAFVDPFDALMCLARDYERYQKDIEHMKSLANEWAKKIHMNRGFKEIGSQYSKGMIPICNHCSNPIHPENITHFTNKSYLDMSQSFVTKPNP